MGEAAESALATPSRSWTTASGGGGRTVALTAALGGVLVGISLLSLAVGAVAVSPGEALTIVAGRLGIADAAAIDPRAEAVLLAIRLPRILLGVLVGAGLGVSGAAMQGLFRNPLADPALVGVSSGAALAAVAVIVLGAAVAPGFFGALGPFALPPVAFAGGLAVTLLVHRLSSGAGRTSVETMLLAGIAVNAIAGAGIGLLTFLASDAQLRTIAFWSLGTLGGATWSSVGAAAPFLVLTIVLAPRLATALNVLALGEADAYHLGVAVERVKRRAVALVALGVGASVAVAGAIGFVGLVVPHLLRLAVGPDHRRLLPISALLGAILLLAADLVARTAAAPAELPLGTVTAAVGAPFFLWLVRDRRRRQVLG